MRTDKIAKNFLASFLSNIMTMLIKLGVRTAFIYTLGMQYLGVSGLFTSVLTALSVAELGIGSAMSAALYKPLAESNVEKVKSLMRMYRRAYRVVGLVMLALGAALTPLLPHLLKDTTDLVNIYAVFALYVLNMVVSYTFFAYKTALIVADQKNYLIVIRQFVAYVVVSAGMIAALLLFRFDHVLSFYVYTVLCIVLTLSTNLVAALKVEKLYPYLRDKNVSPLPAEEKTPIYKNIAALSMASICVAALTSIDNIVISSVLVGGVGIVGIYANYLTIMNSIKSFTRTLTNALTPSIGNVMASESPEKTKSVFDNVGFLCFWLYGFCFISFWVLYNPFIGGIWINESWLLSDKSVLLISLNFLLLGLAETVERFIKAGGLHWHTRYYYALAAILNIGLSFLFAGPLKLGLDGVFAATTVSLLIIVIANPFPVFRVVFGTKPWGYLLSYFGRILLVVATGMVVRLVCLPFCEYSLANFAVKLVACLLIPNALWFVIFRKTAEFIYLKNAALSVFGMVKKRLPGAR